MPSIMSALRDITANFQQNSKSNAIFTPNADSGIQFPHTPTNDDYNYQTLTNSPLLPLPTPLLPMNLMPIRVHTLLRTTPQFHEAEQSISSSPKKKIKVSDFTSNVKAKYKRCDADSSLRKLERDTKLDIQKQNRLNKKTYTETNCFFFSHSFDVALF